MEKFITRKSTFEDKNQIFNLYKKVSKQVGGLARSFDEITESYVENFINKSHKNGLQLVIQNSINNSIVAEIHCYRLEPKIFEHILSELTIVVNPDFQSQGLGKIIFQSLLDKVSSERKDILRIELIARESNLKAIRFYQKLGFVIEGRFEKRIKSNNKNFEADIPMVWFNKNYFT